MANETLGAKMAEYTAKVEKALAKNPERQNLAHNRLYTPLDIEGFDYEIQVRGNRVGIRIVPGGRITKGTTVLVDYDVGITSNLNHQVQINTNLLSAISETVVNADQFIQGLKHHWFLRSAFKTKKTNAPPAAPKPAKGK